MKWKVILIFVIFFIVVLIFFIPKKERNLKTEEFYKENWGYEYLNIDLLRNEHSLDGSNVKVALIDTGVSSFIDVTEGVNIFNNTKDFIDDHGHGTHMAGILSSKDFGVAPGIDLYVVKALNEKMYGEIEDINKSLVWALEKEVDIILMPFGTLKDSPELKATIDNVIDNNIVIVSSVGNHGLNSEDSVLYPAKYENVIGVGALNKEHKIWKGTAEGTGLDILLPGQYINSYSLNGDDLISSGTSMASAYMAGLIALYIEEKGNFSKKGLDYFGKSGIVEGYHEIDIKKCLNN